MTVSTYNPVQFSYVYLYAKFNTSYFLFYEIYSVLVYVSNIYMTFRYSVHSTELLLLECHVHHMYFEFPKIFCGNFIFYGGKYQFIRMLTV